MDMLGAGTSEGADKKKGIGEFKMGCFNRPLCVRSPDFARQPRLPKGKKVKGKKVKSRDLQCAMLIPLPGYFCKRAKEASTARTLSLNI